MKILFIFGSANGLQTYMPIISALLEKGCIINIFITPVIKSTVINISVDYEIEQKRLIARYAVTRDSTILKIAFVENIFSFLYAGYTNVEHVLKPEDSIDEIISIIKEYYPNAFLG